MQELPKQLDRAAQRAELDKRVAGLPFAMPEIVRRTRDEDLYFSIIADRCEALTAMRCSSGRAQKTHALLDTAVAAVLGHKYVRQ